MGCYRWRRSMCSARRLRPPAPPPAGTLGSEKVPRVSRGLQDFKYKVSVPILETRAACLPVLNAGIIPRLQKRTFGCRRFGTERLYPARIWHLKPVTKPIASLMHHRFSNTARPICSVATMKLALVRSYLHDLTCNALLDMFRVMKPPSSVILV